MKNYFEISKLQAKKIQVILTDIDGTITTDGELGSEAYDALWRAKKAGIKIVPITGRPAGWCDMIARFWPVSGVVGENGAFYFYMKAGKMKRFFWEGPKDRADHRVILNEVKVATLKKFPELKEASDQFCRETDLAIDFCEDVKGFGIKDAKKIKKLLESHGLKARVSSIHVNAWVGDYDKLKATKHFISKVLKMDMSKKSNKFIYLGDSPNDIPMFEYFSLACGIGNIKKYGKLMTTLPPYICAKKGGKGFAKVISHILSLREEK